MDFTTLSLENDVKNNLMELKKIVEDNSHICIIKNGKILFNQIDSLKLTKNSSDINLEDNVSVLIFKDINSGKLLDTDLLIYPQYVSFVFEEPVDKIINNKRINNIIQSIEVYVTLMNENRNNNNNKRMGQKYFDIVKSSFNKDPNLDDITKFCAPGDQCSSRLCCSGSNKYYNLFSRAFNANSDLFFMYALKKSSLSNHHRKSSNWSNKIVRYDSPHIPNINYTNKYGSNIGWSTLNLDIKASHDTNNQSVRLDKNLTKSCNLSTFEFNNKSEIKENIKHLVDVVKIQKLYVM